MFKNLLIITIVLYLFNILLCYSQYYTWYSNKDKLSIGILYCHYQDEKDKNINGIGAKIGYGLILNVEKSLQTLYAKKIIIEFCTSTNNYLNLNSNDSILKAFNFKYHSIDIVLSSGPIYEITKQFFIIPKVGFGTSYNTFSGNTNNLKSFFAIVGGLGLDFILGLKKMAIFTEINMMGRSPSYTKKYDNSLNITGILGLQFYL